MRVGAAALAGGIFGALGTVCFFLAFGTDYWLVASDNCGPYTWPTAETTVEKDANDTELQFVKAVTTSPASLTLHHEGFFWRCVFQVEPTADAVMATFFTNQPESKVCVQGYLFPFPVVLGPVPHPIYDATAVFRGFWTVFIILALASALTGSFLLVCGVPFISHRLYKLGGAFLIIAACLFLFLLLLFILWMEVVDVKRYILQERGETCTDIQVSVLYGLSFMMAAAGVPLELLSGLIFMLVGRVLLANKFMDELESIPSDLEPEAEYIPD
ncbi:transmembrane protein 182-like isoform X2 [Phyllopteryx taeniolatus]|uniref:transmembrane protein 182-like isoform X2 n=2 Tax=Phyllopteryx taeniolatus TaxID=161469 RepID=UPI002AD36031|nr:transmembrane protein 182-like isoform X2 [Phyllopteryx taeniolatus]